MKTSEINIAVSKRLVELCSEKEIKTSELSKKSGVSVSTIKRILREPTNMRLLTLKKLCKGLDVTMAEFFKSTKFSNLHK